MTSDSFSRLYRKFVCVRSRQSPSGLETSWLTSCTSSPSWWMRSPNSPRGPTMCETSTWARVRISIWELTAATLTSSSPLPLNLP
uniref:Uncharacterized protein n=1 Tax=Nomascus leucogenys TaxID=61853 RepID=A0A2I3HPI0_NOMLE